MSRGLETSVFLSEAEVEHREFERHARHRDDTRRRYLILAPKDRSGNIAAVCPVTRSGRHDRHCDLDLSRPVRLLDKDQVVRASFCELCHNINPHPGCEGQKREAKNHE